MSQGAINNNDLLTKQAEIIAEELIYCGFNLVFAPVLDINSNPDNPTTNKNFNLILINDLDSQFAHLNTWNRLLSDLIDLFMVINK